MNNENDTSIRLKELGELLHQWLEKYPDEDFKDNNGIDLILLGYDNKYDKRIAYSIVNKDKPLDSVFNAYNFGLGKVFNADHELEKEIFYGVLDWYAHLFVDHPELHAKFDDAVNFYRNKKQKDNEQT